MAISGKAETILDATERLFTRYGYRRTAMEDVAREAGVAKGTLYLYFETKAALFRAMLARNIAGDQSLCDAVEARGGTLADVLYGQLDAWFATTLDRYGASEHFAELTSARASVAADIAEAADRAYEMRLVRLLEKAQVQGQADLTARGVDAARFVTALLAAARGAKYAQGSTVPSDVFRARLHDIATLFAAAVRS